MWETREIIVVLFEGVDLGFVLPWGGVNCNNVGRQTLLMD